MLALAVSMLFCSYDTQYSASFLGPEVIGVARKRVGGIFLRYLGLWLFSSGQIRCLVGVLSFPCGRLYMEHLLAVPTSAKNQ